MGSTNAHDQDTALTPKSDSARCRIPFPGSGAAIFVACIDSREGFALAPAVCAVGRVPVRSMPCLGPLVPFAVLLRGSPCEEPMSRVAAGRELFWFFFDFPMPKKDMVSSASQQRQLVRRCFRGSSSKRNGQEGVGGGTRPDCGQFVVEDAGCGSMMVH